MRNLSHAAVKSHRVCNEEPLMHMDSSYFLHLTALEMSCAHRCCSDPEAEEVFIQLLEVQQDTKFFSPAEKAGLDDACAGVSQT